MGGSHGFARSTGGIVAARQSPPTRQRCAPWDEFYFLQNRFIALSFPLGNILAAMTSLDRAPSKVLNIQDPTPARRSLVRSDSIESGVPPVPPAALRYLSQVCWLVALLPTLIIPSAPAHDDLTSLSDEFDAPPSLSQWKSVWQTEGWGANQLLTRDINTSQPGRFVLTPHSSTWYRDWRGVLEYKEITGDFVVTTDVEPRRRSGPGAPQSLYSLAGIMVRAPRPNVTSPTTWTPGGENYVFLSLGTGDSPGNFQFEVKTTQNSDSVLNLSPGVARARIQVARIGSTFIMLRQNEGGSWIVHQRYQRPDFPQTAQVGLTTYTDWNTASQLTPLAHNQTVIQGGAPDLIAAFEYVRFARPIVPAALRGRNFGDPGSVSDAELTSFLGLSANVPGGANLPARLSLRRTQSDAMEVAISELLPERSYRIESSANLQTWTTQSTFISRGENHNIPIERSSPNPFLRVATP